MHEGVCLPQRLAIPVADDGDGDARDVAEARQLERKVCVFVSMLLIFIQEMTRNAGDSE